MTLSFVLSRGRSCLRSFMILLLASPGFAQNEFIINTSRDSTQRDPQIERDATGNYVVVWSSKRQATTQGADVYFQRFNANDFPQGSETLVNTTTAGDQERPALAMNPNGDFVVVWASFTGVSTSFDIIARVYRANAPLGNEFLVNTFTSGTQTNPDVAVDSVGNFVVVWESWNQDGGDRGVYAQRFNANGNPLGAEFRVNTVTAFSQARPTIKQMRGSKFLVVWESWKQDIATPSGYGVFGKIFDANGSQVIPEFQINTYTNDYQWFGDAEISDDNGFVVVWCSWRQDGFDGGIVMQRFDASANRVGAEIVVNKTKVYYQWLPKIRRLIGGGYAVVWSSWKQDGSREGVFAQLFDNTGRKTSFETQINSYTASYQWEPDFVATGARQLLAVWSSWGQVGKDYEIVARRVTPENPQGYINPTTIARTAGRTTSLLTVHVLDTTALTGNQYEVSFDTLTGKRAIAHIRNLATGDSVVPNFALDRGEGIFYRTQTFQGVAVEFIPEFDLELDSTASYFANRSGSTLITNVSLPTAGTKLIAPIDAAIRWGATDTLPSGDYVNPLDTALNISGQRVVQVPFIGWNLTDNEKMTLLVVETTTNNRWNAGERIVFLTPPQYRRQSNNTHAQVSTFLPAGTLRLPTIGDTNVVVSMRPLTPQDKFRFTTSRSNILDVGQTLVSLPHQFVLEQNYPNPFNPTTTIAFTLSVKVRVSLKVFDILGREVRTLMHDEELEAGQRKIVWDGTDNRGRSTASGIYFYKLQAGNFEKTNKMLLVK